MRKGHHRGTVIGYASIIIGLLILLAMILPPGFWWFALGVGLVAFGLWINSRACC
jgi:hypothetical protein